MFYMLYYSKKTIETTKKNPKNEFFKELLFHSSAVSLYHYV